MTASNLDTAFSRGMRRIRTVEETIAERYAEQQMRCPTHLSSGQEAVSAAAGLALRQSDLAVSGHRAHAHYIAKGGDIKGLVAEIYGKADGCSGGKGGSMHLVDESVGFIGSTAIVGGTIPVGVGLAYGLMMQEKDALACIFLGDAAVETGAFYESLNFAVLKHLPVLFLCENNLYSVYSPLSVRQTDKARIHQRVAGLGCETRLVDGNDVVASYEAIAAFADEVRSGGGPRFLEFDTFRWREHCGPNYDDDLGYRPPELVETWFERDPVALFEKRAVAEGRLEASEIEAIQAEVDREVADAFETAIAAPFPPHEQAGTHVFADEIVGARWE